MTEACSDPSNSIIISDTEPLYLNFYLAPAKLSARTPDTIQSENLEKITRICYSKSLLWGKNSKLELETEKWTKETQSTYGFIVEIYKLQFEK